MKHKKSRYGDYKRSSSRERSDASRRRHSSRSRRGSYSGDYRSMTRSRSREPSRRKTWRRSRSNQSRSFSSSSSRSSSSSSRSRSRSRKASPTRLRPLRNGSEDRNATKDKTFPSLNLPLGRLNENSYPADANSMQWFDQRTPYSRQTPNPPPPPTLGTSVPHPPPAPNFDAQILPTYQAPEQSSYPPPNFPEQNFSGNYQENYHEYGSYYQGVNPTFPSQAPATQQHNYRMESGPPPSQSTISGPNWDNLGFSNVIPPAHSEMAATQHPHGFKGAPESAPPSSRPPSEVYESSKKEAVEQELAQQKRTLAVQREEYFKRKVALTRELNRLKDQKRELLKEDSNDNDRILKENSKLQGEIIQKLESMDNVIEMLSNIIGDKAEIAELMKETSFASEISKKSDKRKTSGSRSPHKKSEKAKSSSPFEKSKPEVNVVHYDPEIHWCSVCDIFPRTVAEYLSHLHTDDHKKAVSTKKNKKEEEIRPWRVNEPREPSPPTFKNATSKRVPIRGVQFLTASTAWYCSLCKMWAGDAEIANRHLRGQKHASNYREFISQNPHWEVDWLTERTRAYERNSDSKSRGRSEKTIPEKAANTKSIEPTPSSSASSFDIGNLGDRLLAMIAASSKLNNKEKRRSSSRSSRSSSNSSSNDKKRDKKKKKKKKEQKREEDAEEVLRKKKREEAKKKEATQGTSSTDKEADFKRKDRKGGKGSWGKGRNYDEEEKESEINSHQENVEKKGRFGELEWNRQKEVVGKWNTDSSDRNYRRMDKSVQPFNMTRSGPKNVQAGPDSLSKDFHGPAPLSPKRTTSQTKVTFYGPKEPPKKEQTSGESKDKKSPDLDKKIGKARLYIPGRDEEENNVETVFEKKTSESAAKKKEVKKMTFTMPKSKLPFIGRMPILKKKVDAKPEAESEKEPVKSQRKTASEDLLIPLELQNKIPNPQIFQEITEEPPQTSFDSTLPKSTLIISKRPRLCDLEVGRKEVVKIKTTDDNLQEQDMEIEEESAKEESILKEETVVDIEVTPAKDELHKDFKDALDLLFPEEKPEGEADEPVPAVVSECEQVAQSTTSAPPQAYGVVGWPQPHQGLEQHAYAMHYDQAAYMQQHMPYMAAMGYEQHPGMYAMPPAEYLHPSMSMAQHPAIPSSIEQQMPVPAQALTGVEVPSELPQETPNAPGSEDEPKPDESPAPPVKKNPPGQRLRRHLKKKAMMEAEKKKIEEEEASKNSGDGKVKPEEMSELALLGIEEDDITAQNFF